MSHTPRSLSFPFAACLCIFAGGTIGLAAEGTRPPPAQVQRAEIHVGINDGDLRGADNRVLQAAIDYIAQLGGGGTVHIGPGRYVMRNALTLRDGVDVVGVPGQTILEACDGFVTRLTADGDANERQITIEDPSGLRVGDGIAIQDSQASGFAVTTATLTAKTGPNTFRISAPLYLDYMVSKKATAKLVFPVVGGWHVKHVLVQGLTIDGRRDKAQLVDGCRAGGIYLFESEHVTLRDCAVRNYLGDGISFQVSSEVTVEDCLAENNGGLGIHPGSGSQKPVVRRNRSYANGSDGLYVCWRVKDGLFEQNEIRGNKRAGISIGHKDTDNLFRDNTVAGNASAGILFRRESDAMGAHRNVFENNRILDNGTADKKGAADSAAVVIQGSHCDLVFRGNTIGNTKAEGGPKVGILVGRESQNLKSDGDRFQNVEKEIERQK